MPLCWTLGKKNNLIYCYYYYYVFSFLLIHLSDEERWTLFHFLLCVCGNNVFDIFKNKMTDEVECVKTVSQNKYQQFLFLLLPYIRIIKWSRKEQKDLLLWTKGDVSYNSSRGLHIWAFENDHMNTLNKNSQHADDLTESSPVMLSHSTYLDYILFFKLNFIFCWSFSKGCKFYAIKLGKVIVLTRFDSHQCDCCAFLY